MASQPATSSSEQAHTSQPHNSTSFAAVGQNTIPSSSSSDSYELEAVETHEDTSHPPLSITQSRIQVPQSRAREYLFIATLCSAQLLTQVGLGMILQPLHIIGASFGETNPGQLSWYVAAYSLTVGTFILPAGRLGDTYGHKRFFVIGFLWYALWSLLGGFAVYSDEIFFDITRAMQGIGPAFMLPNAIAILGRTYPPGHKQQMIFAILGAMAPSGYAVGAVFSSLLAERAWWPWGWWIMAIACVMFSIAGALFIPHTPSPVFEDESISILSRIDAAGSVTGVIGLVLINFAWNQAPVVGWSEPYVYVLLIVGFLFMTAFVFIESRAAFPLVPFQAMSSDVGFVLACVACGWASFGIWLYYIVQILINLRGDSPLLVSGLMTPLPISGAIAALTTGFVLRHTPVSVVMVISMLAFAVGIILVGTMPVEQTYWIQTFLTFIIMPWGMDMSYPAATIVLSNAVSHEHQGLASSLVNTVVNYSISLGLGFAGTVEVHVNDGGVKELKGYRGALYMGIGLACLGVFISTIFVFRSTKKEMKSRKFG